MAVASLFEDLLDQYKIEQHISEKRYTNLYQAYDVDDDRQVRIDILRPEFAEDSSFAGRFVNRARALAQVRHSNIAQVLHVGKAAGGGPYVAEAAVDALADADAAAVMQRDEAHASGRVLGWDVSEEGPNFCYLDTGGLTLGLVESEPGAWDAPTGDSTFLDVEIDDPITLRSVLAERGVAIFKEELTDAALFLHVRDPEGNLISFFKATSH